MGSFSDFQSQPRKSLGQFEWIIPLATGLLQSTPAVIATYNAKRAADKAKQDRERANQAAAAAKADAEAKAKAEADAKAKADAVLKAQGLDSQGSPIASSTILGLHPAVALSGLGILLGGGLLLMLRKGK